MKIDPEKIVYAGTDILKLTSKLNVVNAKISALVVKNRDHVFNVSILKIDSKLLVAHVILVKKFKF